MENNTPEQLKEQYADFIAILSDDDKAKVDACVSVDELITLIEEYNGELPDDIVEAIAGGNKANTCPEGKISIYDSTLTQ